MVVFFGSGADAIQIIKCHGTVTELRQLRNSTRLQVSAYKGDGNLHNLLGQSVKLKSWPSSTQLSSFWGTNSTTSLPAISGMPSLIYKGKFGPLSFGCEVMTLLAHIC